MIEIPAKETLKIKALIQRVNSDLPTPVEAPEAS